MIRRIERSEGPRYAVYFRRPGERKKTYVGSFESRKAGQAAEQEFEVVAGKQAERVIAQAKCARSAKADVSGTADRPRATGAAAGADAPRAPGADSDRPRTRAARPGRGPGSTAPAGAAGQVNAPRHQLRDQVGDEQRADPEPREEAGQTGRRPGKRVGVMRADRDERIARLHRWRRQVHRRARTTAKPAQRTTEARGVGDGRTLG